MQVGGVLYHVSSARTRQSIPTNGLDWRLMDAALGIAGNIAPEVEGYFLCLNESDAKWFTEQINNTSGAVDVWEVHGVELADLVQSPNGYSYYPRPAVSFEVCGQAVRSPRGVNA